MALTQDRRTAQVERWGDMVYRLALARTANVPDAEDVFQEVFLRYFRHEDRFQTDEHRKAWLLRCTVNRCKSLMSSPWRKRTVPLETAAEVGVEDDYREVYSAVLALPEKYRAVIHLHYFEGLSVAEIAAALQSTRAPSSPSSAGAGPSCGICSRRSSYETLQTGKRGHSPPR